MKYIYPLDQKIEINPPKNGALIKCQICGNISNIQITDINNLRENCFCKNCGSTNRQRQIASVLLKSFFDKTFFDKSLLDLSTIINNVIYNTEASGVLHDNLNKNCKHYYCSEYFGNEYLSGDKINGVLNQNLMDMSFSDCSIDVVISTDVFEHIPSPYKAFKEVFRVLKSNGRHIFTVPFHLTGFKDDTRAICENNIITHLKEPIFHGDPVRINEGVLVYTIFSLEMLIKLFEIGFETRLYRLNEPKLGIFGNNAIVFESIKR